MKWRVALRNTGLVVLILVALGGIGYLARGEQTNRTAGSAGFQEPAVDDANVDVMSSIDRALGRQTSSPVPPLSIETKPGAAQAGPGAAPAAPGEQPAASTTQDRKIVQTAAL